MKKNCGTCKSRMPYANDPEHYICDEAAIIKRVSSKHRACKKHDQQ